MRKLYPEIEPNQVATLSVSELHTVSFEEVGNPNGRPALFLHGGPGVGIHPIYRRFFDPAVYRIILIDQRGAGNSTPHAETRENTTFDVVGDLERLRSHLGIDSWVVMGGSWGSLLALCYAIRHPTSVAALIIRGVFLGRPAELDWLYGSEGAAKIYPDEWWRFCELIDPEKEIVSQYVDLLNDEDRATVSRAAQAWARWEGRMNTLFPDKNALAQLTDTQTAISIARLESHYTMNRFFLPSDNFVLESVATIEHIPCFIVQGRYDIICPPVSAWNLHKSLPDSQLNIVPDGAHAPTDSGMIDALIQASDSCANS